MVKRPSSSKSDRSDPKRNKSLAIRNVLRKMPSAKAAEVVAVVKKEYGHTVNQNRVYMVKTKTNMAADGRVRNAKMLKNSTPMTSPTLWVEAIKTARQLLKATGSVPNAVALLKAVDS